MINPLNFKCAYISSLVAYRDHLVNTTPENEKYGIASELAAIEDVIAETQGCTKIIRESHIKKFLKKYNYKPIRYNGVTYFAR